MLQARERVRDGILRGNPNRFFRRLSHLSHEMEQVRRRQQRKHDLEKRLGQQGDDEQDGDRADVIQRVEAQGWHGVLLSRY